jgi:hypothetical protein
MVICVGRTPSVTQEASYGIVVYALANLIFDESLYFVKFLFFRIASTHIDAPYVRLGPTAYS